VNLARQSSIGTTFKTSHWYLGHSESLACTALALKAPYPLGSGSCVAIGRNQYG
jgi:hypothetical protein